MPVKPDTANVTEALRDDFRVMNPLRCPGRGGLMVAESSRTGDKLHVRWLPDEAEAQAAISWLEAIGPLPCAPKLAGSGRRDGLMAWLACEAPAAVTLAPGKIPLTRLFHQIASLLERLHQFGLVHGSLSAESVLVSPTRTVVQDVWWSLLDARTDRRPELRELTMLPETVGFLAPERARGDAASAASDVYSLGALICFAHGTWTPSTGSALAMLAKVVSGEAAPSAENLDPVLKPWVTKMLAKDPGQRPTAAELAAVLFESTDPFAALVREKDLPPAEMIKRHEPTIQVPESALVPPSAPAPKPIDLESPAPTAPDAPRSKSTAAIRTPLPLPPHPLAGSTDKQHAFKPGDHPEAAENRSTDQHAAHVPHVAYADPTFSTRGPMNTDPGSPAADLFTTLPPDEPLRALLVPSLPTGMKPTVEQAASELSGERTAPGLGTVLPRLEEVRPDLAKTIPPKVLEQGDAFLPPPGFDREKDFDEAMSAAGLGKKGPGSKRLVVIGLVVLALIALGIGGRELLRTPDDVVPVKTVVPAVPVKAPEPVVAPPPQAPAAIVAPAPAPKTVEEEPALAPLNPKAPAVTKDSRRKSEKKDTSDWDAQEAPKAVAPKVEAPKVTPTVAPPVIVPVPAEPVEQLKRPTFD